MEIMVSVNCTTYNHGEYIGDALESFLMQKTDFKYEILVHDDASTDNTADIIKEYARKYPDIIKPIIQDENKQSQGVKKISYKYNHTRALGKYIAICEGDDYWLDPNKLQKQIDYMENHLDCTMCFHAAKIINSKNKQQSLIRPYTKDSIASVEDLILGGGGFCPSQSIVYRKEAFDNPPYFYFKAPVGDYPLQIITAHKGYAFYIDDVMSVYRKIVKRGTSWSSKNKSLESNIILHDKLIEMLQEFDEYTNSKYKKAINHAVESNNFYKSVNKRYFRGLLQSSNYSYFCSLPMRQKLLIMVRLLSPTLYSKMVDFKYR